MTKGWIVLGWDVEIYLMGVLEDKIFLLKKLLWQSTDKAIISSVFMEKWILTKNMPLPHFYLDPSSEVYQMRQNPKNWSILP